MAKLSEKNTKAELLNAIKDMEASIAVSKQGTFNPQEEVKTKKDEETLGKASSAAIIIGYIGDVKNDLVEIFNKMTTELEDGKVTLSAIEESISIKKAELKELFDIEASAYTLAALIDAHSAKKEGMHADMAQAKAGLQTQLDELTAKISTTRAEFELDMQQQRKAFDQEKSRAKAEWDYNFTRSMRADEDALGDKLALANKGLAIATEALNAREAALDAREAKQEELEEKIASFPAQLDAVKADTDKTVKAEIEKILAIRLNAQTKEVEADRKVMQVELAASNNRVAELAASNKELQAKLDDAYSRIQNMGVEMVQSMNQSKAYDKVASAINSK